MKTVTINERAAAMAMDFVVGEEARSDIEDLYSVLDQVERQAAADGYALGWMDGFTDATAPVTEYYEGDSGDETDYKASDYTYAGRQPGETQYLRDDQYPHV
jgi:hypothetical protein